MSHDESKRKKDKLKSLLDYAPLVFPTVAGIPLITARINGGILLNWKHLLGLLQTCLGQYQTLIYIPVPSPH
jgi:hypothetical protein